MSLLFTVLWTESSCIASNTTQAYFSFLPLLLLFPSLSLSLSLERTCSPFFLIFQIQIWKPRVFCTIQECIQELSTYIAARPRISLSFGIMSHICGTVSDLHHNHIIFIHICILYYSIFYFYLLVVCLCFFLRKLPTRFFVRNRLLVSPVFAPITSDFVVATVLLSSYCMSY